MKKTGKIISLLCLACAVVLMTMGIAFLLPENLIQGSKAAGTQHITYPGADGETFVDNGVSKTLVGSANTLNTLVRTNANTANAYFVLVNDIDLSGFANWTAITTLNASAVFDGNNYSIKNLKITSGSTTGLFGTANGTVKNLVMENISITTSGTYVGAIAGKSSGSASRFENIIVSSGTFTGTGNAYGAIIGEVSGGKTTVESCLNAVNIKAAYFIGGLIGHSTGSAIINISKCANEGNIEATSTSYGYTGGIFGLSEGSSNVTIEWSYNKGTVKTVGTYGAGILGCAWSGTAVIRNCFNDSVLNLVSNQGGITTRSSATVTITNCYYNNTLYTGAICNTVTGVTTTVSSGLSTSAIQDAETFLPLINAGAPEGAQVFVSSGGQICLAVFNKTTKLTFMVGTTEYFILYQDIDDGDGAITLPGNGTTGYQSPEKIGFDFLGWENIADNQVYEEGDQFLNPQFNEITFDAVFEKITYTINCINETGHDVEYTGVEGIKIGETDNLGTDEWEDGDYNWLVKFGNATGENLQDWVNLGSNQNLPLALTADFITKYADAGCEITFKIIRTSTSTVVNVRSTIIPDGLGSFNYSIKDGDDKISEGITANMGGVITLPTQGQILKLEAASSSKYYKFSNFILYNNFGTPVDAEIEDAIYDCSDDQRFSLTTTIRNGYTIEVNFEKVEFDIDISAELRDGDIGEENYVTLNSGTESAVVSIGESIDIGAVAAVANSQGNYKFSAWKIYDMYEDGFVYLSSELEFVLDMASFEVTDAWLDQYLYNGKITIIAEYVEMYSVSISVESGQDSFGTIIIHYADPLAESGACNFIHNVEFSAGSVISISVSVEDDYEFAGFVGVAGINQFDTSLELTVTGTINITAVFKHKEYNVLVESKDSAKTPVKIVDFTDAIIGTLNASGNKTLADTLDIARAEIIAGNVTGYIFTGFTIKNAVGDIVEISSDAITDELLKANLDASAVGNFIITANFIKIYKLSTAVSEDSLSMGDIYVYIVEGDQETLTDKREFGYGTELKVKAKVKEGAAAYFEFDGFFGKRDGEGNAAELSFIIDLNRTITAHFKAKPFTLSGNLKTKGTGKLAIDNEANPNLILGDTVVLMANPGSGKVVKNWTVNGVKIKDLEKNSKYEVSVSENNVTIVLTSEWLTDYGTEMNSLVEFKMSGAIMMAILIPSIIVPLLLILFAIYFINYRRKMAIVKKHLQEENRTKVTRGVASFIEDIREGKNVGQVTKEDVKQAMKKKKDDK